ncbi:hypothetical protein GCM10010341_45360 [Streptomyces noursei]|nr:hypothetical protein GCM10010341_45360 [Streptomyces noursei]
MLLVAAARQQLPPHWHGPPDWQPQPQPGPQLHPLRSGSSGRPAAGGSFGDAGMGESAMSAMYSPPRGHLVLIASPGAQARQRRVGARYAPSTAVDEAISSACSPVTR